MRYEPFVIARARYWRRCQLWHNARSRMGDAAFFQNLASIEQAISAQLDQEFAS